MTSPPCEEDGVLIYVKLSVDPLEGMILDNDYHHRPPRSSISEEDTSYEFTSPLRSISSDNVQPRPVFRHFNEVLKIKLRDFYHLPVREVIRQLNISKTVFKKLIDHHRISRWPYRRFEAFSIMRKYVRSDNTYMLCLIQEEEDAMRASLGYTISKELELFYRKVKQYRVNETKNRGQAKKDDQMPRRSARLRCGLSEEQPQLEKHSISFC
jgi:hypothetical protein